MYFCDERGKFLLLNVGVWRQQTNVGHLKLKLLDPFISEEVRPKENEHQPPTRRALIRLENSVGVDLSIEFWKNGGEKLKFNWWVLV